VTDVTLPAHLAKHSLVIFTYMKTGDARRAVGYLSPKVAGRL
jgi:hypothetical protein